MSDDLRAAEALAALHQIDETRIETKADIPKAILDVTGREVTTLFSVDNLDRGGDVSSPKAFNRSIGLGIDRIAHLFMHDDKQPAIGRILKIEPIGRGELPEDVQREYPDATGGAIFVSRLLKTGRGAEVFEGIQEGIAYGASFGFITKKAVPHPTIRRENGRPARWLQEVHLVELTTALPGTAMNLVTRARLGKALELLEEIKAAGALWAKTSRRHSQADLNVFNQIVALLVEQGATLPTVEPDPAQPLAARTSAIDALLAEVASIYEVAL